MKPFNLEEALAGKKVVTRDGREAGKIAYFPASHIHKIVACIDGNIGLLKENGRYNLNNEDSCYDLFMASEKKTGWINIYRGALFEHTSIICKTEQEANERAVDGRIACIQIEWEE